MSAEMIRPPAGFQRYPTAGGALHGTIEVDLGDWFVNGKQETIHLRVFADELPKLVQQIADAHWQEKRLGYGALSLFVAGEPLELDSSRQVCRTQP